MLNVSELSHLGEEGNPTRYAVVGEAGKGTFSIVLEARDTSTDRTVAIKLVEVGGKNDFQKKYAMREIVNHRLHNCSQIVRFFDVFSYKGHMCIVMEHLPGGNLEDYLKEQGGIFSEKKARWFFQQIIMAVLYVHTNGVVLRDIKLQNAVLDAAKRTLKLIDYGYSKDEANAPNTFVGSPLYISPELAKQYKVDSRRIDEYNGKAVDIWTCGVCLYRMLFGTYPFSNVLDEDPGRMQRLFDLIAECQLVIPTQQPGTNGPIAISPGAQDMMKKILTKNPEDRITVNEIIEHPWFLDGLPTNSKELLATYKIPTDQEAVVQQDNSLSVNSLRNKVFPPEAAGSA